MNRQARIKLRDIIKRLKRMGIRSREVAEVVTGIVSAGLATVITTPYRLVDFANTLDIELDADEVFHVLHVLEELSHIIVGSDRNSDDEKMARELVAAARLLVSKRPDTLFEQYFHDVRKKFKEVKEKHETEGKNILQKKFFSDLKSKGVKVISGELKLGRYKGSRFVTSFKLSVLSSDKKKAESLAAYLRKKYSPKWKLKSYNEETKIAQYNVR